MLEAPAALKSILVVEDTEYHYDLFKTWLEGQYCVTLAIDGESAESRLSEGGSFDLLILDSKIPRRHDDDEPGRVESFSFLKEFRQRSTVPVILVVSHQIDPALRTEAAKFHVSDILEKPFPSEELQKSIKRLLDKNLPSSGSRQRLAVTT